MEMLLAFCATCYGALALLASQQRHWHELSGFMGSFKPNEIHPQETSLTILVAVQFERKEKKKKCTQHRMVQNRNHGRQWQHAYFVLAHGIINCTMGHWCCLRGTTRRATEWQHWAGSYKLLDTEAHASFCCQAIVPHTSVHPPVLTLCPLDGTSHPALSPTSP